MDRLHETRFSDDRGSAGMCCMFLWRLPPRMPRAGATPFGTRPEVALVRNFPFDTHRFLGQTTSIAASKHEGILGAYQKARRAKTGRDLILYALTHALHASFRDGLFPFLLPRRAESRRTYSHYQCEEEQTREERERPGSRLCKNQFCR